MIKPLGSRYLYNHIQTTIHKGWVAWYIVKFCAKLLYRAMTHDLSKYSNVEAIPFAEVIHENKGNTYGSQAYEACLARLSPCLQHHYLLNSHHPQHYPNGFADMTILDRVEMCADWLASVRRHKDGCITQSIKINQKRFGYTDIDTRWISLTVAAMS